MKNIVLYVARFILPFFLLLACTQFLEEIQPTHAYNGSDGCVYCHTNDARLKVLAHEEEKGDTGGGG